MFRSTISSTPLSSNIADTVLGKISGGTYYNDVSFQSTLRALVAPRMGEEDTLQVRFTDTTLGVPTSADADAIRYRLLDLSESSMAGRILVDNIFVDSQQWFELIRKHFTEVYPEWHVLEKVEAFFMKSFKVMCFINPTEKGVILFVDNMDNRKLHYLQCGIFAFLPWYFNPEDGVTELEMELINSLREKTSQKYEDCIARIAEQYDFRSAKIRQLLTGFEKKYETTEIDSVRANIESCISQISYYNDEIAGYLRQKRDYESRLLGLEMKIAEGNEESEIMDYFLCNPRLVLEDVQGTRLRFVVKDYLTYFDEEMARKIIDNEHGYMYHPNGRNCENIIPHDDVKRLMEAIFIDQRLKIKLCAAYEFRIDGNIKALDNYSYSSECRDYTPNTHIDRYRCLGTYQMEINRFISSHDYIGAIEQCIASCKSLNLGDAPVMNEFMARFYGVSSYTVNDKFIELPDGRTVTPKEAADYLKQEEYHGENN